MASIFAEQVKQSWRIPWPTIQDNKNSSNNAAVSRFLLDFASAFTLRIFNWPLMNFQFDNWQNAAHERVRGHPRGAQELEHATRKTYGLQFTRSYPASSNRNFSSMFACPFAASDSTFALSLSFLVALLHRVKC